MLPSLVKSREILPKISIQKKILSRDDNADLKRLMLEGNEQQRKKNGRENIKQLTKKKKNSTLRNQINEAKHDRYCVEMWRKAKIIIAFYN